MLGGGTRQNPEADSEVEKKNSENISGKWNQLLEMRYIFCEAMGGIYTSQVSK